MSRTLVQDLFKQGISLLESESGEAESKKQGILRAGNSGIYIKESGQMVGSCPRATRLRFEGLDLGQFEERGERELMFQAGRANEDQWMLVLKKSWPGIIKQEEEIGIEWETRDGTKVTGRPDIVLCKKDGTPELGLELKQVSSLWTARDVLFENRPKFGHLCQAAHYSSILNIPFQLWYTCRSDYATNELSTRLCPKMGEKDSQYVEYNPYIWTISKAGKGYGKRISWEEYERNKDQQGYYTAPLKIKPFNIGYYLFWGPEDGHLHYVRTDQEDMIPVRTPITRDRVRDFYEHVSKMQASDELGTRPLTVKGDGSKAGYSMCDYCPLQSVCNKSHSGYKAWRKDVEDWLDEQ